MTLYYSPSTGGFYSSDVHGAPPQDAVTITAARHRALIAGQSTGARIVTGEDGHPKLIRPPKMTLNQLRTRAIVRVKKEAARRIDMVSPLWRQMNDLRAPSPDAAARFAMLDAIRSASATIETRAARMSATDIAAFDIASDPAWPQEDTPNG